jgi:hypothetical protein
MRNTLLLLLGILLSSNNLLHAQDALFATEKAVARKGIVIAANGNLDFPGGDMAKRFGTSYRVGGAFMYKTKQNLMYGLKCDYLFGSDIREDSLLINIRDAYGQLISTDGQKLNVGKFERGIVLGVQAGKILNTSSRNADIGILVMTGLGFIQHKIHIYDKTASMPQISKDYKKGYDRLTNGWYIEQFVGYNHFSKNALINFYAGFNLMAGFTKGRRDYLYDVMRTDDKSRIDLLFGIRAGWYIPVFKRKSEELFFE